MRSFASYFMNTSLALSLAALFFLIISVDASSKDEAGRLLSYMFGKCGLNPNTSWLGLNPDLFRKAFLAATAHASAICILDLVSSMI